MVVRAHRNTITMYCRKQLTVWIALVACACALPSPGANDIQQTKQKITDVISKTEVEVKAVTNKTEPKPVHERFPHAVLFGRTCGGSIISPNWVLTAGHCTLFTSGRHVLGATSNSEDGSGVERLVKRLIIHPLFTVGPYWLDADEFNLKQVAAKWDFLLVELEEPLPLDNKTLAAAKLDDQPTLPAGLNVSYAGYGTEHHGGVMRSEMHAMDLAVQPDEFCSVLEQYNPQDMVCTQGRPPRFDSACNGDSGSGLVDDNGRLIGVASWVENDARECRNGNRVIFSRVSSVRDWIKSVTNI